MVIALTVKNVAANSSKNGERQIPNSLKHKTKDTVITLRETLTVEPCTEIGRLWDLISSTGISEKPSNLRKSPRKNFGAI
jgi:hypothetical protein